MTEEALCPIHKLPPELLAKILSFTQPPSPFDSRSQLENPCLHSKRLVRMTRVCRYWKDTALIFPRLWSRIEVHFNLRLDVSQMFLSRSGQPIPLDIHIYYTNSSITNWLATTLPSLCHRSRELFLHCSIPLRLIKSLSLPAPHLQRFSCTHGHTDWLSAFREGTPQLRTLQLPSIEGWSVEHFHDLTHFTLTSNNQYRTPEYPLRDVVTTISTFKKLEVIFFEGLRFMDELHSQPFALQNIKSISFIGCSALFSRVTLSHIILPRGAEVPVLYPTYFSECISNVIPLSILESKQVQSLDIRDRGGIASNSVFYQHNSDFSISFATTDSIIFSAVFSSQEPKSNNIITSNLGKVLELKHLQTLHFDTAVYADDESQSYLWWLSTLKNLVTLSASFVHYSFDTNRDIYYKSYHPKPGLIPLITQNRRFGYTTSIPSPHISTLYIQCWDI